MAKKDILYELLLPEVEKTGYECYDVDYEKIGKDWILTVYIDNKSGIGLDDCEKVSRALSSFLDETNPIDNSYTLEVSSPGLERKLTRHKHFIDNIGKKADIRLYKPMEGTKRMCGVLKNADDTGIVLEFNNKDIEIPYEAVSKASLHFEF